MLIEATAAGDAAREAAAAAPPRTVGPRRRLTLLTGVVLIAPLPIGAVQPWAWGAMSLAVAALLALHAWALANGERPAVSARRIGLPLACFGLVMGWAAVQALPLEPGEWRHPLWAAAAAALGVELPGAISVNPAETVDAAVRLATYAAIFYLALNLCRDAANAERVLRSAAAGVAAYAAYGLAAHLSGAETILWFAKTSYLGDLTGTFVNRNSYATFAGLGLLCAAALVQQGVRRAGRGELPRRERARRIGDYLTTRGAPWLGAVFLIACSLFLSHSRAGLASAILGLGALMLATALSRRAGAARLAVLAAAGAAATLVVVGLAGTGTLVRALNTAEDAALRLRLFERTVTATADAPLYGTGLGSFRDLFQLYRTADIRDPFHQAHNSYLENALELGVPAAALLLAAAAAPAVLCASGLLRRRRGRMFPCLGIAATVLVAAHSLVDFSLQIPAVAALYALLMGAAAAQSWSSRIDTSR